MPYEDAVLDFSNPDAVKWYQDKIAGLLKQGVSAIKVDFGEAAPAAGFLLECSARIHAHMAPRLLNHGNMERIS
jgi:alpha-D-xyloside xylohydrolase